MTVRELTDSGHFEIIHASKDSDQKIGGVFCCDLLSVAMAKAPEDAAWVTVMGNVNALAVLKLTDMACIILAEGAMPDDACRQKAVSEGVTILRTALPVFDTALLIHGMCGF